MTPEERKNRWKYFPKEDGVETILNRLKKVYGDKLKISESGIRSVLYGTRGDNWGILDIYEEMTDEVKSKLTQSSPS